MLGGSFSLATNWKLQIRRTSAVSIQNIASNKLVNRLRRCVKMDALTKKSTSNILARTSTRTRPKGEVLDSYGWDFLRWRCSWEPALRIKSSGIWTVILWLVVRSLGIDENHSSFRNRCSVPLDVGICFPWKRHRGHGIVSFCFLHYCINVWNTFHFQTLAPSIFDGRMVAQNIFICTLLEFLSFGRW